MFSQRKKNMDKKSLQDVYVVIKISHQGSIYQKYSNNSNILKYYYNLDYMRSVLIYLKKSV